ncbi:uncharacterized protein SOCEGT47_040700 [Sorangium cellulosum]|uniref:Secreted protein n=1 Tax=Sorangium cellulosum TaxID=56 RepID=A0A4P2Q3R0_SORCE|nr:DUF192 domain-containing protein [Sorangium cellulosum]AUX23543.1 uncharacterized protein SOCEGT47_040700 [Sorangium cellulosum]
MSSRCALAIRPFSPALPAPHALALAVSMFGIAAGACERRVDEPAPLAPRVDRVDGPARDPAPPASTGTGAPGAGRCIHATPATPERPPPTHAGPDPACPDDPTGPFQLATGKVIFLDARAPDVLVEVARKEEERARGLMYRKSMPEDRGMIFVFEQRRNHAFWMHNTCISLDMLFIDRDGTIVGIQENTPTLNDSTFQVGCPSTYVLELNAGWARRHGVVAGQKVRLEGI